MCGMKILVIGGDPSIFNKDSENFSRISEYAGLFDELHIVSFTAPGFKKAEFSPNLFLYPTNTFFAPLRAWDAYRIGRNIAKARQVDIIDAQDSGEAGLVAYLISRITKIPFRIQIHTDIFSPYYRRASWKERVRFMLAKFLIPRANCIRVVSERIKSSIISNFPAFAEATAGRQFPISKISVLPIFTDISKFIEAKPDPRIEDRFRNYDFKMVAVGRLLDKEKNFSMLIEVMRDFIKICPKAVLALVGSGSDEEKYRILIKRYGLENHVIIEPWRDDLPSFLKSFDLFLLPSNYEGWGRAVTEAMAAGLPVVMTDVGLAGEIVKEGVNGIVVPVGDKKSFLRVLTELYQNPGKRKNLALAGENSVKNLNPKTKEEYLGAYEKSMRSCLL